MKKSLLCALLVLIALLSLIGCAGVEMKVEKLGWSIVQSPVTGRYYEIATRYDGYQGYMAMSEVSQTEYVKYLELQDQNK